MNEHTAADRFLKYLNLKYILKRLGLFECMHLANGKIKGYEFPLGLLGLVISIADINAVRLGLFSAHH